jgi:hypothetical protein
VLEGFCFLSLGPVKAASVWALSLVLAGCSSSTDSGTSGPATGDRPGAGIALATTMVERRDLYQTLRLEGTVERYDPVTVTATATGQFYLKSTVRGTRTVTKGETLGSIKVCRDDSDDSAAGTAGSDGATGSRSGDSANRTEANRTEANRTEANRTEANRTEANRTERSVSAGQDSAGTTCDSVRWVPIRASGGGRLRFASGLDPAAVGAVTAGQELAIVQRSGFRARLPVTDAADLYGFNHPPRTARAQIVGGPSGFTVRFERTVYAKDAGRVSVLVSMPAKVPAFAGLHVVVVFVTSVKDQVPSLPRSAVQGSVKTGLIVRVAPDGRRSVARVGLGGTDDQYVEVKGLEDEQKVLLYPLESDFGPGPAS